MSKIKIPPIFPGVDYVYAVLAQEKAGPLYVKFGKSSSLAKRFGQLRTGSPIPVRYYAFVEVRDDEQQTEVEQALHQRFADRRVNGEWFKFDANSTEDKRDFNDGCTEVFLAFIGPGESWSKVSAANLPLSLQERRRIEKNSAIAFAMMHINSDYPGRTNDFYYED